MTATGLLPGAASRAAARVRPNSGFTPTRFFLSSFKPPTGTNQMGWPFPLMFQIHWSPCANKTGPWPITTTAVKFGQESRAIGGTRPRSSMLSSCDEKQG
jgi:hypothetical protein